MSAELSRTIPTLDLPMETTETAYVSGRTSRGLREGSAALALLAVTGIVSGCASAEPMSTKPDSYYAQNVALEDAMQKVADFQIPFSESARPNLDVVGFDLVSVSTAGLSGLDDNIAKTRLTEIVYNNAFQGFEDQIFRVEIDNNSTDTALVPLDESERKESARAMMAAACMAAYATTQTIGETDLLYYPQYLEEAEFAEATNEEKSWYELPGKQEYAHVEYIYEQGVSDCLEQMYNTAVANEGEIFVYRRTAEN